MNPSHLGILVEEEKKNQPVDPAEHPISINRFKAAPQPTELGPDKPMEKPGQKEEIAEKKENFKVPVELLNKLDQYKLDTLKFFVKDAESAPEAEYYISKAKQDKVIDSSRESELKEILDSKVFSPEQPQNLDEDFISARNEYVQELELYFRERRKNRLDYANLISNLAPGKQMPLPDSPESLIQAENAYEKIQKKRNLAKIEGEEKGDIPAQIDRQEKERDYVMAKIREIMADPVRKIYDKAGHIWADSWNRLAMAGELADGRVPAAKSVEQPVVQPMPQNPEIESEPVSPIPAELNQIQKAESEKFDEIDLSQWTKWPLKFDNEEIKVFTNKTDNQVKVFLGQKEIAAGEVGPNGPEALLHRGIPSHGGVFHNIKTREGIALELALKLIKRLPPKP